MADARGGRPPKPGGRKSQVEIQRAYRERLRAAGKVVRVVDAACSPEALADLRERLYRAASRADFLQAELSRLREREAALAAEVVRLERELTLAAKQRVSITR